MTFSKKINILFILLYIIFISLIIVIQSLATFNYKKIYFLFYELFPCLPLNKFEKYEEVLLNEFLLSLL